MTQGEQPIVSHHGHHEESLLGACDHLQVRLFNKPVNLNKLHINQLKIL